ncbi:MAG: RNase adapter RapZ [Dictyoglomaceae bacterium]|nr:RNase adapter RapZ [Dictyoglomaceae bacterium]
MKKDDFQLIIITGLSGAGKSQALHILEDVGFFCVDNLPPNLIPTLIELCINTDGKISQVALVTDIRSEEFLQNFKNVFEGLKNYHIKYMLIFLEAEEEVLVRRYNETRRRHPLAKEGVGILESISLEKQRLEEIRSLATYILDTSNLSPKLLREKILNYIEGLNYISKGRLFITIYSFGFKYGIPLDSHLIFDVRFLPNPYYEKELRFLSGDSPKVKEYLLNRKETQEFLKYLKDLLDFLIPLYQEEGKTHLNISIGCTGGRHRAVVIAELLRDYLSLKYSVKVFHRDILKDVL